MRPLIIYHASCTDGFASAFCAWKRFGDGADYLPAQYGDAPPTPDVLAGKDVYILDFSYKRAVIVEIAAQCNRLTVLDHHLSAQQDLANLTAHGLVVVFDMEKCGAHLAWDYFHPTRPMPDLVRYVEDRDLWRWKLPDSREISAAIASHPFNFHLWDGWAFFDAGLALKTLANDGRAILRYQQQQVDTQCKNAVEVEMDGHRILCVNATVLISEIAGKLAENKPFGATFFINKDGKRVYSLRSAPDGVDVSEIAKKRGGGGHLRAAGFTE